MKKCCENCYHSSCCLDKPNLCSRYREMTIEEMVYEMMCANCEKAHYCHNVCENCDEYEDEVNRLYEEEGK